MVDIFINVITSKNCAGTACTSAAEMMAGMRVYRSQDGLSRCDEKEMGGLGIGSEGLIGARIAVDSTFG